MFLAKCESEYKKGDEIIVTTRYGKENESIVFNFMFERDGYFYYSIVRADGFDVQEWAKRKSERYENRASSAERKSNDYYKKSNKHSDFLSLGEPIKVGHHSEKRHRKIIEQSHKNMDKCVEYSDKAKENELKADYWAKRANTINLSMPESIDFYEYELEKAKETHKYYKENPEKREHSYSLTYANKKVKDTEKKYNLAKRLWG